MACIKKIKALLICPNELPKVVEIPNTLKSFQAQVNGKIAVSYLLKDNDICLICNDEGKFNLSKPNRSIGNDIIYDNFLIVGDDYVKGDFKSLTKEQILKYQKLFDKDSITRTQSKINARKLVNAIFSRR